MTHDQVPLHHPITTPIDDTHAMCLRAVARIRAHVLVLRAHAAAWDLGEQHPYPHHTR